MKSLKGLLCLALAIGSIGVSNATQQCFNTVGANTYGAVGVTIAGCTAVGIHAAFGPPSIRINAGDTCTYTFNKPIVTSTLSIGTDSVDTSAVLTITTSAGAYTSAVGDIGPHFSGGATYGLINLVISGAGYVSPGPGWAEASGNISLTNSPPATITSVSVHQAGFTSASLLNVCADDGGAPPVPAPTLSEWAMITFAMLIVGFGVYQQRRRQT